MGKLIFTIILCSVTAMSFGQNKIKHYTAKRTSEAPKIKGLEPSGIEGLLLVLVLP